MLSAFQYEFVQRGLVEILLLSIPAGILGTWIILRGLTFYSHAVGTAAFPGLVVADGLALSPPLCAFAAAIVFAVGVERLARRRTTGYDSLTALVLVGALALGVVLASDVFHSGASVETLLFGSLLLIGRGDLVLAAIAGAAVLAATAVLGRRWLADGFDRRTAHALGARSAVPDALLLALIALGVVSALSAVGALLATALFVVPAATVRLLTRNLTAWRLGSVALAAAEGVAGLWMSVELNVPPGAAIAVLGGAVFAVAAVSEWLAPKLGSVRVRVVAVAGSALIVLVIVGCGAAGDEEGRLDVVATTTQIGDWVRNVAGPEVSVHQILEPNTDPHEYEPRPDDVVATSNADVVFENGDRLDAWMAKVVDQSGGKPTVVVLGERVPVKLKGDSSGPESSRYDPHWWHDPRNAEEAVAQIRDALVHTDPAHRQDYERRAAAYLVRVRALDSGLVACFSRVPAAQRKLVTNHDAFNYFAARYGIRVVGAVIPSQTTQAQPSAGEIAKLIGLVKREHVHAVFPESSINPRLADTIARETGASSSATLYGDTLGPASSKGATYLGMEKANADAMVRGFTRGAVACRVPGTR